MARPKVNPDYDPEGARDELVKAVAAFYEHPESEEMMGKNGKTKMIYMQREFGLSMSKIRKLLVTAGVYEFIKDGMDLVTMIAYLRERGYTDEQIRAELSISVGTLNSLTPYKAGTYNADFTADGYDFSNVSTDARRKRSQRKRDKMKDGRMVDEHEESIGGLKLQMDDRKYPGMTLEQIEKEKIRYRKENEAVRQERLERRIKDQEREEEQEKRSNPVLSQNEVHTEQDSDHRNRMILRYADEMDQKNACFQEEGLKEGMKWISEASLKGQSEKREENGPAIQHMEVTDRMNRDWYQTKTVNGKPIGDFLFTPDFSHTYRLGDHTEGSLDPDSAIGVIDANHEKHVFCFEILGATVCCRFQAREVKRLTKAGRLAAGQPDTEYAFFVRGDLSEEDECIQKLIERIVVSLQNLSITRRERNKEGIDSPGQCLTDKYVYHANEIGRIRIVGRESFKEGVAFQIDGHIFDSEDAVKLFDAYEGWEMQYIIRDPEDVLTNDMTLYPIVLNEDTFMDELERILMALTDRHAGAFLGKGEVSVFDLLFEDVLKKLHFYYQENRDLAVKTAASMIRRLKKVGTDSTLFPEYEIQLIRDAIKYPWEQ